MRSDFRAGLVRVAAYGRQVFLASETPAIRQRTTGRWALVAAGAATVTLLIVAAWYAGREAGGLEAQRVSGELNQLSQQIASTRLALAQERAKSAQLEKALKGSNKTAALALESQLRRQLLQAQAEANQYKAILDRERQASSDNSRVLDVLSSSGARLIPLKGAEAAAQSIAYALIVERSHLLFVASNLPELPEGRQFQLWLVRKQDPKVVSAAVFAADDDNRAFISFNEASVLSDIAQLDVTEEPDGGSSAPTGAKLFESAAEPGRPASDTPSASEGNARVESSLPFPHRGTSQ